MDHTGLWASALSTALLALLPLLFPRGQEARKHFTAVEMQVLTPHMQRFWWISGVVVFVSLMGCVGLICALLAYSYPVLAGPSFDYPFPFMDFYWFWPGMALGFALSLYVTHWVLGRFMGRKYDLLMEAGNQQYGVNSEKAMRGMFRFGLGVGLAGAALGYNWYAGVYANPQEIVINPFLSLREHRYPLRDITAITYVDHYSTENGRRYHQPYYAFRFRDGYRWDTREGFRYFAYNTDSIPVKYLLRQTGLRMDTVARRD